MGSFVQYPINRDWIGILYAAGEVSLARNAYDDIRPCFYHYSPCNCAACGHRNGDAVAFGDCNQILYLALSTCLAVFYISSNSDTALMELKTMGQQNEELFWPHLPCLGQNQAVVNGNKRAAQVVLADTKESPDSHEDGKEKPYHHAAGLSINKKVPTPQYGEHQGKRSTQAEQNQPPKAQREDQGKMRAYIVEPHIRHVP